MSQNWIQWHYLQVKILLFFFYHFLFELQASCPDSSNRTSSFILKIFLFNSSNNSRTSTKGLQLPLRGNYTHTHIIFFTVSFRYDCPVSRFTVQDKPLCVITTIQNRISQFVHLQNSRLNLTFEWKWQTPLSVAWRQRKIML